MHDILMLGTSPIKWRQRLDMTIADSVAKPQLKQRNISPISSSFSENQISYVTVTVHFCLVFVFVAL